MRAVDVQSFAGGFTLGVAQAGFEVVGKRELPGGFGVPSVSVNVDHINPALEIQVGADTEWAPVSDLAFGFGNPPCSGFSGVSDKNFAGIDSEINKCMWSLVEYFARCRGSDGRPGPEVIAYESVQNAYSRGLPLLRQLHHRLRELTGERYTLVHTLHNGLALGGAAERRRYFWVAARIPFGLAPYPLERTPVLWDTIADLTDLDYSTLDPQPYRYEPTWWSKDKRRDDGLVEGHLALQPQYHRQAQALLDRPDGWRCGESLGKALRRYYDEHGTFPRMDEARDEEFARHYGPADRDFNFGGAWQPERWFPDRPARVITGGSSARSIHPTEPRPLTLREMYRIQGFPDSWRITPALKLANANTAALWPGKGIPVQSGRWIAEQVRAALEGTPHDDGRMTPLGEDEYVWNGTGDARPKTARRPVTKKTTTPTKETPMAREKTPPQPVGTNDPEQIRQALLTSGTATVNLAGLDDKDAKKARELLYAAAYGAGRKVKVRTDKASSTAIGTLLDATHEPASRKPKASPAPAPVADPLVEWTNARQAAATANEQLHEWPDGTTFALRNNEWTQITGPKPEPLPTPTPASTATGDASKQKALVALAPGDLIGYQGRTLRVVDLALDGTNVNVRTDTEVVVGAYGELVTLFQPGVDDDDRRALIAQRTNPQHVAPDAPPQTDIGEIEADEPLTFEPLPVTESGDDSIEDAPSLQPKNSKREVKDRRYDLTQLRAGSHGYYVHRDYASHYFRWGWAARHCRPDTRLLDLGSGQDLALARVLIYHNGLPESMVAVDLNKLKEHVQPRWLTVYDETNICDPAARAQLLANHPQRFNLVTCFEVIEHMPAEDGALLLGAIREALTDDGYALLSTPVFNGKAAANHIHEYTIDELRTAIEAAGLKVVDRYGTFASYHDVKKGLEDWVRTRVPNDDAGITATLVYNEMVGLYERCREFYADDVMANFMAPALPDFARNNAWKLARA